MKTEQTTVAFIADDELMEIINELKQRRKTKNTSQIVREAIFSYFSFFENGNTKMDSLIQDNNRKEMDNAVERV